MRSRVASLGRVLLCLAFLSPLHPARADTDAPPDDVASQDWNLHFQMTGVVQGTPAFHGTNGPQSLDSHGQIKETVSDTMFVGIRMPWSDSNNSTELYMNPETTQGFGLSHTQGVAGFPSGEKANSDTPDLNLARVFVRQTFGFGGEQETVASDENQLAEARDISRLTVSVGKMAVTDFFDNNSYSHDTRTQFMNYALIDAGAYDYAADQEGYTDGAVLELNQKDWTLRYGYFFEPTASNSENYKVSYDGKGSHNLELEQRYSIAARPGVFRILGFANYANAGSYRETLENPALALNIAATRKDRIKYGFILNAEQALSDDLGVFSRLSWNDGQEEIMSSSDIDQSFSVGTSLKGSSWDRPDDTVGLAGAVDLLSQAQIEFLKAGGAGFMIGDGALNYAPEDIVEAYYCARIFKSLATTFDYQFIANPAYDQNRGPANVFSVRAHLEF